MLPNIEQSNVAGANAKGTRRMMLNGEDRDTTIDRIAQAVIDRIEERSELTRMVEMVAQRVMELQKQEAALREAETDTKNPDDTQEDGQP